MLCGISRGGRRPVGIVLALSEEGVPLCLEESWVHYMTAPLKARDEDEKS